MGSGVSGLLSGICGLEFETGVWDSRSGIEGLVYGGPGFMVCNLGHRILGLGSVVHDSGFFI